MIYLLNCTGLVFSVDLKIGYHPIRIKEGDEWKTAFKTKYGLYEWFVMPYGHNNIPITFMRLMDHILWAFIRKFVGVNFDDIINKSLDERVKYLSTWCFSTWGTLY